MLFINNITYVQPNKELLFEHLQFSIHPHEKIALIGNNGVGKSTLLQLIAGNLKPTTGKIDAEAGVHFVPQLVGQFNQLTVAEVLGIDKKLAALHAILAGEASEENFSLLEDDWTIEERAAEAFQYWQLHDLDLHHPMESLSGGQKTKVFLAGIVIHQPDFVLLDEPTNHLDAASRNQLYEFVKTTSKTLLIVSHDRSLLNLLTTTCELSSSGITTYGGNYDFYAEQKEIERNALNQDIHSQEKALRKAKEKERETSERQQKLDARGKKKQEKAGVARIMMNTLRNNAENSSSKVKGMHQEKIAGLAEKLQDLRSNLADADRMKLGLFKSELHKGKVLAEAENCNFHFANQPNLWATPLNFQIRSGDRLAIKGPNGSGKSTLIELILGNLTATAGRLFRADFKSLYIDQDYSMIRSELSVYEQAENFNHSGLEEHEIKIRLNRFLFTKDEWSKSCSALSGGERMRLLLCCLSIENQAPDVLILDEPTNNLDMQNMEILTNAFSDYNGTLLVVSHDAYFLEQMQVDKEIVLSS
ncbi:ribosomal protection-like ABC-F family protein [Sphingobacterium hungaricum]|uniref:ABC transporter ATP-binding protein n=1 Tax=Sphingobacterium hungaricum TaxID=2082723 RepID=A0A928YQ59_9SPHI|nr:ABC-F family ATP-binding cassette domain-containing protein [Sphingobacterium hungaricum]MBE8713861.1 ABC transporter ATP-binding protein [Sphingobacterium hungaricum]